MKNFLSAFGMICLFVVFVGWNFGEGLYVWGSRAYQYFTYKEPSALAVVSVNTFIGMCLSPEYRAADHVAFADEIGWEPLPEALVAMQRPPAPQEFYKGWIAYPPDFPEFPFFAYAGRTAAGEAEPVETCGAFFRLVEGTEFVQEFVSRTDATLEFSEENYAGWLQAYSVPALPGVFVSFATPGRNDVDMMATAIFPIAN